MENKRKSDIRGEITENRVVSQCIKEVMHGTILRYWVAPRGSSWDRSGYDVLVSIPESPHVVFPIQIKSSRWYAEDFREEHPDIPFVVAGSYISSSDLDEQFRSVLALMREDTKLSKSEKRLRFLYAPREASVASIEFDEVVARTIRNLSSDEESPCVLSYFRQHTCSEVDLGAWHCTMATSLGELTVVLLYEEMPLDRGQHMKARRRACERRGPKEGHLYISLRAVNVDKARAARQLAKRIKRIIAETGDALGDTEKAEDITDKAPE